MISFPGKLFRVSVLSLCALGVLAPNAYATEKQKIAAAAALFAVPFISSYIALTQDPQPAIKDGNAFEKMMNWYRRVICGQASKKSQKGYLTEVKAHMNEDGTIQFDDNVRIKDVYSESSGLFGTVLSWYDANEKDVKKAIGIAAIPAALFLGYLTVTNISELLVNHALKGSYGEGFTKNSLAVAQKTIAPALADIWIPVE